MYFFLKVLFNSFHTRLESSFLVSAGEVDERYNDRKG